MNDLKKIDLNDIIEDLYDRIAKVFFDLNHSDLNCEVIDEENN